MTILEQILAGLQQKFAGVDTAILTRIATKKAEGVTDETKVNSIVEGISFSDVLNSYGDFRAGDASGRKNLYDAWNRVIHRMGLRLLSSHIPNTLRYNKEADPVCKGVFRSTLFPPDPRQEKDSGLPELVEEICHAIGLEESDTER